jgi:hypothetical protein
MSANAGCVKILKRKVGYVKEKEIMKLRRNIANKKNKIITTTERTICARMVRNE